MNINIWGPACWNLFHTLAEKIKDDHFIFIGNQLYNQIVMICYNLPCSDCSQHAKMFLSKVDPLKIKTKNDLKNLLFVMHNAVNNRKQKQLHRYENLETYKNNNLINVFNAFSITYNTNGNLQLITENFHRVRCLQAFTKWLKQNINHFDY
jgi:hypothetical protein